MSTPVTRREALKTLAAAGAGIAAGPFVIRGQGADLMVAGRPVEIAFSAVSPVTVRITIRPIVGGAAAAVPEDGALVQDAWGAPLAQIRSPAAPPQPRTIELPGGRLSVTM